MSNNVFIIKELEDVREYKEMIKIKRVDFETLIVNLFHRFSSKKSINKNVNNSKTKHSFSIFNNDLIKTLKKIFRSIYNDLNESSFFENDLSSTTSYV